MSDEALRDHGPIPIVVNIEAVTEQNDTFRTALWTGNHLQLTLMRSGSVQAMPLSYRPAHGITSSM